VPHHVGRNVYFRRDRLKPSKFSVVSRADTKIDDPFQEGLALLLPFHLAWDPVDRESHIVNCVVKTGIDLVGGRCLELGRVVYVVKGTPPAHSRTWRRLALIFGSRMPPALTYGGSRFNRHFVCTFVFLGRACKADTFAAL